MTTGQIMEFVREQYRRESVTVAPALRGELAAGYDTSTGVRGMGMLVQVKRPCPEKNGYRYRINDTAQKDQLLRLLHLERLGYPVYYVLPMYHLFSQVSSGRRELCAMTAWYTPAQILLKTGPIGRFDLFFNHDNSSWSTLSNERKFIQSPMCFAEVMREFREKAKNGNLKNLLEKINDVFHRGIHQNEGKYLIAGGMAMPGAGPARSDFLRGQFVVSIIDKLDEATGGEPSLGKN